ncbi:MAG: AIR synthase-related protein [Eubacteriales bacterium]|nr:AIR synthase-related protein [Eubacteriales bacterium]
MRTGKVKESIWKRSIARQLHRDGEDVLPMSFHICGTQGWTLAPRRVLYGGGNLLATEGDGDGSFRLSIFLPEGTTEERLKGLIREIAILSEEMGVSVSVEQAVVSPRMQTLLVTAAVAGTKKPQALPEPHMDIVVAGTVGREGAAMAAIEREQELLSRYAPSYIEQAKHLFDDADMRRAVSAAKDAGAVFIRHLSEGGVFAGLWELAAAGKVGLDVALKRIPIKQHTIEVCEFFRCNPYMMFSAGSLLMTCKEGESVVKAVKEQGIPAAVIGKTTEGNDKIIRYDDEVRYLEPPKEDEYYKRILGGNYA